MGAAQGSRLVGHPLWQMHAIGPHGVGQADISPDQQQDTAAPGDPAQGAGDRLGVGGAPGGALDEACALAGVAAIEAGVQALRR